MAKNMRQLMTEIGERIARQSGPMPLDLDRDDWRSTATGSAPQDADAGIIGQVTGNCGETMIVCLSIEHDRITDISCYTNGCSANARCGSIVADLAKGRTLDQAAGIGADTILREAGELNDSERHCAYLAAEALHAAIHNWMRQAGKPRTG